MYLGFLDFLSPQSCRNELAGSSEVHSIQPLLTYARSRDRPVVKNGLKLDAVAKLLKCAIRLILISLAGKPRLPKTSRTAVVTVLSLVLPVESSAKVRNYGKLCAGAYQQRL